ncbi:restriction endonuclease subunit S [Limosilactobacillus reuteri]
MMAKEKKKVPNLRFKGFTDDWEQRKLGDVVNFFSGLTYHPSDVKNKGYFVIRSSNIQNNQIVSADDIFVNKDIINVPNVKQGDIIVVVRNGSRKLIGKHAQVLTDMPNTVIGAFMTGVRSKSNFYINALLDSDQFQKEIYKNLGATINQITIGEFRKMRFIITSGNEAQTIGEFFKKIDTLITLQQRKLDLLKQFKKGLLQKMFADKSKFPILRFEGFHDEWEQRKLGEISTSFSGGTPSVKNKSYYGGKIPFIRSAEIHKNKTELFITESGLKNSSAKLIKKGTLLYALYGATSGEVDVSNIDGAINQAIMAIFLQKDNVSFIKYYLEKNKDKIIAKYLQGGQGNLSASIIKSVHINLPFTEEQLKISNLIKKVESLISLQHQKLAKYQSIKKSLLQQMFM